MADQPHPVYGVGKEGGQLLTAFIKFSDFIGIVPNQLQAVGIKDVTVHELLCQSMLCRNRW